MAERILTLHPQGKQGVNIHKSKYDQVAGTILELVKEYGEISYSDLNDKAIDRLEGHFDGKIPWYVVTVKLDLEARGVLVRIPKTSPHRLKLG